MINCRRIKIIWLMACLWLTTTCAFAVPGQMTDIVIAWDGSGDYGPQTPGTTTCGWQEAIDYCLAMVPTGIPDYPYTTSHPRDIYVKGGVYNISNTIYIRNTEYMRGLQDFRIQGGDYTMNWVGPQNVDMLFIDSVMDLRMDIPHMVYNGTGAALHTNAIHRVMWDNILSWGDTQVKIISIIRTAPGAAGTGALIENADHVDFWFGTIRNFATCLSIPDMSMSQVRCLDLRSKNDGSVLCSFGGLRNFLDFGIGVDQGATGVKGLDVTGANNVIDVTTRGGFAPGNEVIFESSASGNRVNLAASTAVSDPSSLITDNATTVSNEVTWPGQQIPVKTISITGSTYTYTQKVYPAVVRVVGGMLYSIVFSRRGFEMDYGVTRSDIMLAVGDQLRITSFVLPTIRIVPMKSR